MPIKTVILDRDGTLYNEHKDELQPGVSKMLSRLGELGLQVFVVSNEKRDQRVERLLGLACDRFLYKLNCGVKGSTKYVQRVLELTSHETREVVYLGDSDLDMREAAGSRIALFNAEWSNPGYKYGLGEPSPDAFVDDIERYFLKGHPWYFTVDGEDAAGRQVMFRALLDPDTCKDKGITHLLKNRSEDLDGSEAELASHLVMHLLASLYLDGIHLKRAARRPNGFKKPVWCLYPGSDGGVSPILRLFERFTARLLTMAYEGDLLQRHKKVGSSHRQRMSGGGPPSILSQFNSVQVNPDRLSRVRDNIVLVVDDFSTGSNAMETARSLLYACGAQAVIGLAVGKYGDSYTAWTPRPTCRLPPQGGPVTLTDSDLLCENMPRVKDATALNQF